MKYTLERAIKRVKSGGHKVGDQSIDISGTPGIKVWGALDYLIKHHNYRVAIEGKLITKSMLEKRL